MTAAVGKGSRLLKTSVRLACEMYPLTKFLKIKFAKIHSTSSKSIGMPNHLKVRATCSSGIRCVPIMRKTRLNKLR